MKKQRAWYIILSCIGSLFILYTLLNNFVLDPGAEYFLSHKTGLSRELHVPIWLNVMYVHVVFACIAMASGLLNFSKRLFRNNRKLHRLNGYIYVGSVIIVILTSGYMAPYATGGKISSIGFNALNIIWLFITVTAYVQIMRKRITSHRNWMMRSYAFCFTNLLIHLLTFVLHQMLGFDYPVSYTIGVYGSIALLLIIPNMIILTRRRPRAVHNARIVPTSYPDAKSSSSTH